MHLRIDVAADPGRHARLVRAVLGRTLVAIGLLGLGMVALGVVSLMSGKNGVVGWSALACGLGAIAARMLLLHAGRREVALCNGPWTYELSDAGITMQNAVMRNELSWAAFTKAQQTGSDVVLHLARYQVIGIPRASLAGRADDELAWFLRSRGLLE